MNLSKDYDESVISALTSIQKSLKCSLLNAGIAQLVERNLAKVEVASSSLVSRSSIKKTGIFS
jgi:hypothetical protein